MGSHLLKSLMVLVVLGFGCAQVEPTSKEGRESRQETSLADIFQDEFFIGTALSADHIAGKANPFIATQFNAITAENIMKWMHIHPAPDSFNFQLPDQFVALGEANNMQVVGHTLVWHSQTAPWVNDIKDSLEMAAVLDHHINTIVHHFKGKVQGWDVVNEALNEDGSLRESIFLKTMGESYLKKSFDLAAAADPEAELYYNDYNLCQPAKRAGCIEMIKKLQATGTPIHGVGIQGHFGMKGPSLAQIEQSIEAYSALGLKVMFTEVDITVLPAPWDVQGADVNQSADGTDKMNPYVEGMPDSMAMAHAQRYADIFRIFLKHSDKVSRVTFWGVDDGHSWKNNWPIRGRTDYTLVFDRQQKPKMAFDSIVALKRPHR